MRKRVEQAQLPIAPACFAEHEAAIRPYHFRMTEPSRFRWAWLLLAYASLGLGIVGIFVPGLPTTVFILLAAYAAARGSERLHDWLLAHPLFGPMIRDWQAHGAVARHAKWTATATMLVCAAIMLLAAPRWAAYVGIACMATVAVWLWLRPEPPHAGS